MHKKVFTNTLSPLITHPRIVPSSVKEVSSRISANVCMASFSRFHTFRPNSYQPVGELSLNKSILNFYCLEDSLQESSIVYIFIGQWRRGLNKQMNKNIV